ncbi:GIY-YIG nuclease family protein [Aquicoccus sp.]|uniref:GIY-YIG nuclease family protein n=1 Tax=Aquicoccus sp. TaxID=2055851 RepID=UPI003562CB2A
MTLADRIRRIIEEKPGITDAGLTALLPGGPSRHQQVNQRCRQLAAQGVITRDKRGDRFIGNFPANHCPTLTSTPEGSDRPRVGEKRPPGGAVGRCPAVQRSQVQVSFAWHSAGEILKDAEAKPRFPRLSTAPGLYRLRLPHDRSVYVGETINLRRRMQNYRTPGSRQKTSIWVNKLICAVLNDNRCILLETCTDLRLLIDGRDETANLSSKTVRCVAENAALLSEIGNGWTPLNKAD